MPSRRSFLALCLLFPLSSAACALYTRSEPSPPQSGQATVVFMQGRSIGGYAYVYEGDEFLGVTGPGTRIEVSRPPGQHTFEVVAQNLDFMTADLQAGQTYHATVRTAPSFGDVRVYFQPRNDQGDTADAYASTTSVVPTDRGQKYGAKYKQRKDRLYDKTWTKWNAQPDADKAHLSVPTTH